MSRRALPMLQRGASGLGRATIMSRALAAAHGARYVHLAAFAIDVDRVREALEERDLDADLPLGWEVFLTAVYLVERFDLAEAEARAIVDEVVADVLEREAEEPSLGAQLVFAVRVLVSRGLWSAEVRKLFASWKSEPDELIRSLAPLWADQARWRSLLASRCLSLDLEPPLAPPTLEALEAMTVPAQ